MAQILRQQRKAAFFLSSDAEGARGCCINQQCILGYHGIHPRVRTKSRARHHGNATGQSKGGQ